MYYSADYRDEWCKGNDFVNEMQTDIQLFNDSYHLEWGRDSYKDKIKDDKEYIIVLTPHTKRSQGEYGWRWHKWGEYIGVLNPQCEYLDDEEFGEDFKYILCFNIYKVK
jgi:hypothetical protein